MFCDGRMLMDHGFGFEPSLVFLQSFDHMRKVVLKGFPEKASCRPYSIKKPRTCRNEFQRHSLYHWKIIMWCLTLGRAGKDLVNVETELN